MDDVYLEDILRDDDATCIQHNNPSLVADSELGCNSVQTMSLSCTSSTGLDQTKGNGTVTFVGRLMTLSTSDPDRRVTSESSILPEDLIL
ncbi:hypothetical protein RRG08_066926 [Elysia crispata]|uniref:Uncharacterized protein n=1 Tax=Elysia crispata TaxID=231223 RepID=A0AAE1APA1_9GAST|nr:hypothetical protein RRG08_066926 [Elysia crispata]